MQSWTRGLLRHESALTLALLSAAVLAFGMALFERGLPGLRAAWPTLAVTGCAFALLKIWCRWQRERLLREAPLPLFLKRKLRDTYPHLNSKDCDLVERGLRQFFLACLRSNKGFVAMPSRVVDALWHEFILHTRAYQDWCQLTLGWFLHHTPAQALGPHAIDNDGLRRAWYRACRDEAIDPRAPTRLPLLFALDAKLQIDNGFHYRPDGRGLQPKDVVPGEGGSYFGTDFCTDSFSGDAQGFGGADASDSSADGGADSGSDGGSCGGGGD